MKQLYFISFSLFVCFTNHSYAVPVTAVISGNWNTPATWVGNAVPPAGADVIIKHLVTGNLTTTCNSLSVQSPGSLTVTTGVKITVLH